MKGHTQEQCDNPDAKDFSGVMMVYNPATPEEAKGIQEFIAKDKEKVRQRKAQAEASPTVNS